MSDQIDGTRGQTPEDARRILSALRPAFAAGEAVPGLSSWVLEHKLGGGGFGEVWLAKHVWDTEQKPRAVKFCTDPAAKNRLVTHERNVVVRVMKYAGKHPNIVPLLDCNLDDHTPWLMYEFVEGGTLAALIEQWRDLTVPKRLGRAVKVLHAVAGALATCHRFDPPLVHRDMKPQNVLMAGTVPRITDFGIGSVAFEPGATTGAMTALAARIPSALQGAGTRLYAPPEQMFGAPPNPREDVYALGIMAYQFVTGDLTSAPGADATLELREWKVPSELTSLIVRSVSMNPDRRPKDAGEWESALAALIARYQQQSAPTDTGSPSKPVLLPVAPPTERPAPRTDREPPLSGSQTKRPRAKPVTKRNDDRDDEPVRKTQLWLALGCAGLFLAIIVPTLVIALWPGGTPTQPTDRNAQRQPSGSGGEVNPVPKGTSPGPKANPKPGDTCEIEIAPDVKMTFCWIPPGTAMLGSPEGEAERYKDEVEHEYTCKGFWLGKYTVTQAEWKAVMGDNPSYFDGTKDNKAKGMNTSRFPVESVSWDRICGEGKYAGEGFLNKIDHGGIQKALGKAGRFKLPTENQWEYAARIGRDNKQPFYFGDKLSGTEANCDGNSPYGTTTKGQYLGRPCAVDFTNDGKYEQHPWGLMHMHGNVYQWCEDYYDQTNTRRVLRGGSWYGGAHFCRAAYRHNYAPVNVSICVGFRLVVPGLP